jgi:hypothetical protein
MGVMGNSLAGIGVMGDFLVAAHVLEGPCEGE